MCHGARAESHSGKEKKIHCNSPSANIHYWSNWFSHAFYMYNLYVHFGIEGFTQKAVAINVGN